MSLTNSNIDGWFTEVNDEWPGQGLMIKVKKILFTGKSKFQDVCIFQSLFVSFSSNKVGRFDAISGACCMERERKEWHSEKLFFLFCYVETCEV